MVVKKSLLPGPIGSVSSCQRKYLPGSIHPLGNTGPRKAVTEIIIVSSCSGHHRSVLLTTIKKIIRIQVPIHFPQETSLNKKQLYSGT